MSGKFRFTRLVFYIFIGIFLIIQVYPIIWLIVASFRDNMELSNKPFGVPKLLTLDNYLTVFTNSNTLLYMKNSAIIAVISLFLIVIMSSMASFAISKIKFRFSDKMFSYFLLGLTIPVQVTIIPLFVMYTKLKILDSYISMILPMVAFSLPVAILLFVNFYKFIPDEIIEAAVIDGCSSYKVYYKVIFPLSLNTVMTVVAMNFIFIWNDFIFSITFINSTKLKTIALGLQDFIGSHGLTDWGATFAAICISTLPTLIIYFALNKQVMGGMTLGAVKS